ncbi:hypothetical protein NDU88_002256 [Pleurodeles waltl]|uniref:Uncharacterized protein n=1 Tax=Pleurodeles waltl TaxID=8319 RepID=A0AAV7LIB6_PLEWA|nr:hypothetical protein NDU88_002256 [Pleurodeles waltl]
MLPQSAVGAYVCLGPLSRHIWTAQLLPGRRVEGCDHKAPSAAHRLHSKWAVHPEGLPIQRKEGIEKATPIPPSVINLTPGRQSKQQESCHPLGPVDEGPRRSPVDTTNQAQMPCIATPASNVEDIAA